MKKINISQLVLKEIKRKKIEPKGRWVFVLKNTILWFLSLLALLTSSAIFSIVVYMIKGSDWGMYKIANPDIIKFAMMVLPYFWIVFLVIFIVLLAYNIKLTKNGYRYRLMYIIPVSILLSTILGIFLYFFGVSGAIDDFASKRMQEHAKIINRNLDVWNDPQNGVMMGMVLNVGDNGDLEFIDIDGKEWIMKTPSESFADQDIKAGSRIKVVGEVEGDGIFQVKKAGKFGPGKEGMRPSVRVENCMLNPECSRRVIKSLPINPKECLLDPLKCKEAANAAMNDFKSEKGELGAKCQKHQDCKLSPEFAIKSNCPHEAKCLNGLCGVICNIPLDYENQTGGEIETCENDDKCQAVCKNYLNNENSDCICLDNNCVVIMAKQ